ncbi:hypothetical protein BSAF29S_03443 [Bacillus safensis subsp. safensis]
MMLSQEGLKKRIEKPKADAVYQYEVTPQMTDRLGNISYGVFTQILIESANRFLKSHKKGN